MILGRPRHVKRIKKEQIKIGTWNVNTMLKTGKMQEIADQIVGSQLQIVALQEVRWKGYGLLRKDKYSVYYSCNPNTTGQAGTGFIIQKSAMNKILGFEPISDSICKLRVKGKFYNMTLINIYAPTEDKEEEIKEQFYKKLQRAHDRVPKHDVIIIMGDMNAKLGKEKVFNQVLGRHTLHNISNENGEMVANYAISNNMFLISTNFQHKNIHIGTWTSPNHQTINQIDHVMVSKEKMRMIHDVRLKRGYNCDSDHFLVQIKIKQKLISANNRQTQRYRWDRQLLNQREKISKYQEEINAKIQEMEEETDINQDWQNLKQVILEAAKEFKSSKDTKNANHWWDEECKKAIQEKNEVRGKCLIRKTRANTDIYHQKRIQANRICRRKKKEWIEGEIKLLNETNRKRDTRKFYKDVRNLSNLPTVTTLICKDKDGNILSEKKQILERWQQYFKDLLNPRIEEMNSIKTDESSKNNPELEEPTYEETNEIIKNMKSNKAAGPDAILPEFIKNGGLTLKQKIRQLIVKV
jgi:endonuclease/exonuclease/phosphatase family metal-dependent hydrolase